MSDAPTVRLTPAQTQAAKNRVYESPNGFRFWGPVIVSSLYLTRREAEEASLREWRDNL